MIQKSSLTQGLTRHRHDLITRNCVLRGIDTIQEVAIIGQKPLLTIGEFVLLKITYTLYSPDSHYIGMPSRPRKRVVDSVLSDRSSFNHSRDSGEIC
jgi:hypothetical protein